MIEAGVQPNLPAGEEIRIWGELSIMKRWIIMLLCAGMFLPGMLLYSQKSNADVNINVTVPLPGVGIAAPPAVVVIPGTYVYFAPDVARADLFFYHGYWYRPYRGEWYYSVEFNGPWGRVAIGNLPPPLINLPPDYRNIPPGYERMPYHMVARNWRRWEEERYWDHYPRGGEHAMPHHGRGGMGGGGMGRRGD